MGGVNGYPDTCTKRGFRACLHPLVRYCKKSYLCGVTLPSSPQREVSLLAPYRVGCQVSNGWLPRESMRPSSRPALGQIRERPSTAPSHRRPTSAASRSGPLTGNSAEYAGSAADRATAMLSRRHTGGSRSPGGLPPSASLRSPPGRPVRPSPLGQRGPPGKATDRADAVPTSPGGHEAEGRVRRFGSSQPRPMSAPPVVRRYVLPPRLPADEESRLRQVSWSFATHGCHELPVELTQPRPILTQTRGLGLG